MYYWLGLVILWANGGIKFIMGGIKVKEKIENCKLSIIIKQRKKINKLENELEALKLSVKDELYKEFMQKLGEPTEMERLRKDNKRLRLKNRELREIIKGVDD